MGGESMRAADDFAGVLERMVELERERDRHATPMDRDHNNLIRRIRSVPIEEIDPKLERKSRRGWAPATRQAARLGGLQVDGENELLPSASPHGSRRGKVGQLKQSKDQHRCGGQSRKHQWMP
jgi:hypothetical protein